MTNNEFWELTDKVQFLKWLQTESFNPVGASSEELVQVAKRWNRLQKQSERRWLKKVVAEREQKENA